MNACNVTQYECFKMNTLYLIFLLADITLLISTNLRNERFVTACDKELSKSFA